MQSTVLPLPWSCRSTTEVAGIGLDSKLLRFAKQHFSALWVTPLGGSAVLCLSAEAGVMLPWGPGWAARSTCISDRCAGTVLQRGQSLAPACAVWNTLSCFSVHPRGGSSLIRRGFLQLPCCWTWPCVAPFCPCCM